MPGKKVKWIIGVTLATLLLVAGGSQVCFLLRYPYFREYARINGVSLSQARDAWGHPNEISEVAMGLAVEASRENWEAVARIAAVDRKSEVGTYYYNLANAMNGELANRLMDYYRLMAESGLRVDPGWVFQCSDLYENMDEGMRQIMNTDPKPEALIVPGTLAVVRLYSWCRKHHIRIGEDLGVFCCDEISAKLEPEPTAITNNPAEIAKTFWEMFLAAERGERVESRCTELFIRTGQTVPSLIRQR